MPHDPQNLNEVWTPEQKELLAGWTAIVAEFRDSITRESRRQNTIARTLTLSLTITTALTVGLTGLEVGVDSILLRALSASIAAISFAVAAWMTKFDHAAAGEAAAGLSRECSSIVEDMQMRLASPLTSDPEDTLEAYMAKMASMRSADSRIQVPLLRREKGDTIRITNEPPRQRNLLRSLFTVSDPDPEAALQLPWKAALVIPSGGGKTTNKELGYDDVDDLVRLEDHEDLSSLYHKASLSSNDKDWTKFAKLKISKVDLSKRKHDVIAVHSIEDARALGIDALKVLVPKAGLIGSTLQNRGPKVIAMAKQNGEGILKRAMEEGLLSEVVRYDNWDAFVSEVSDFLAAVKSW